ncbi:MAG: ExeA family protein [Planctomycetota bacterium]
MYESHWGLRESPFGGGAGARFFFAGPSHEEALARLHFLIEQGRRVGLLLGPAGSGKSLALAVFAAELRRKGWPVAMVNLFGIDSAEFLASFASELGINRSPAASRAVLWRAIGDRLAEFRFQQLPVVALLDDADTASAEVLSQTVRLTQQSPTREDRFAVVLAGQPLRAGRLGARLLELAELRIDLEPWEEQQTAEYLRSSLEKAGRETSVFEPAAVDRIQALSGGLPRRVSQLAELALVAGAGRNLAQIDADVVEAAYQELGAIEVG